MGQQTCSCSEWSISDQGLHGGALPSVLRVVSPHGQRRAAGEYVLMSEPDGGVQPKWIKVTDLDGRRLKDREMKWIYPSNVGTWSIGGGLARARLFDCSLAFIASLRTHDGLLPHQMVDWVRATGDTFIDDHDINVIAVRGPPDQFCDTRAQSDGMVSVPSGHDALALTPRSGRTSTCGGRSEDVVGVTDVDRTGTGLNIMGIRYAPPRQHFEHCHYGTLDGAKAAREAEEAASYAMRHIRAGADQAERTVRHHRESGELPLDLAESVCAQSQTSATSASTWFDDGDGDGEIPDSPDEQSACSGSTNVSSKRCMRSPPLRMHSTSRSDAKGQKATCDAQHACDIQGNAALRNRSKASTHGCGGRTSKSQRKGSFGRTRMMAEQPLFGHKQLEIMFWPSLRHKGEYPLVCKFVSRPLGVAFENGKAPLYVQAVRQDGYAANLGVRPGMVVARIGDDDVLKLTHKAAMSLLDQRTQRLPGSRLHY